MNHKKSKKLTIARERCKSCGLCIEFCKDKSLKYEKEFNSKGFHPVHWSGKCSLCGKCYLICPDNVIEINEQE